MIRELRGATFDIEMRRETGIASLRVIVDGQPLPDNRVTKIEPGKTYKVQVTIPG